jgi:hypothetical protein
MTSLLLFIYIYNNRCTLSQKLQAHNDKVKDKNDEVSIKKIIIDTINDDK